MPILLFIILLIPSLVDASTRWVSTAGALTACGNVTGDADPGTYMTPANMITAGCVASGDIVKFKAATYTTAINWDQLLPSGTSSSQTAAECESHRGCTINANPVNGATTSVITIGYGVTREYIRIGSATGGFIVDGTNCTTGLCGGIRAYNFPSASVRGISFIGNLLRNHHADGLKTERNSTSGLAPIDLLMEYNTVEQVALPAAYNGGPPHGAYIKSSGGIVRFNDVTAPGVTSGTGGTGNTYAFQCYRPCNNVLIYGNIGRVPGPSRAIVISEGSGNSVIRNVFKEISGTSDICIDTSNTGLGTAFDHNVCDGMTTFIRNLGTGAKLRNSICITGATCTITDSAGDLVQAGNSTGVATTHFTDRTNLDYSLVSGSSLIDAGTAISGYNYNGSNPDKGAFETITFSSCAVGAGATSTIVATFTNNVNPPILPASGATTFTARRNGANNALTGAVTRSGDGLLNIPVTTAYVAGNTVDISLASSNITDSAMVGGSVNQPFFGTLTNQSCTNNAGGAPSTFTQAKFELHYYRGLEAAPIMVPDGLASSGAAEDFQNYKIFPTAKIRVRFVIVCGGSDCPATAFSLYRSTGGGYTALTDSFGASGGYKFCGVQTGTDVPSNGGPTTNQLSTAGTFVAGGTIFTSSAIPTITMLNGNKTELEYCLEVRDTASPGNLDLRVYQQDGTALDTYTITPRLVNGSIAAGGSGM